MEGMIDVSDINLARLVGAAYGRSRPQGMGHYHFQPGPLPQDTLAKILGNKHFDIARQKGRISMDYVLGRAVKMTIFLVGDKSAPEDAPKRFIGPDWYDHTEEDLISVLVNCGLSREEALARITSARAAEKVC